MKRNKLWSKSFGERGHKVRIYEARASGPLMRSIFINGKEVRRSLGHRDRDLAKQQAYEFLAQLGAEDRAIEAKTITLGTLERHYLGSPSFAAKKSRTQEEDRRRLDRVVQFLGPARRVETLSDSDVRRFTAARRRGDSSLVGVGSGIGVRDRTVQADLVALHTMLNWGAREKDENGRRLLTENPLHGVPIPREKNPRRPLVEHPVFEALLIVSATVNPMLTAFLTVIEGTGRRLSACRLLRWSDVNLETATILWRSANDKKGYEAGLPVSTAVRDALRVWQAQSGGIGMSWVFPSPKSPAEPICRHVLDRWLRRAYSCAGIEPKRGGLWHPFRRKFATERKTQSAVDVAHYAGWRDLRTLQGIYQQPDVESMKLVATQPSHRITSAL